MKPIQKCLAIVFTAIAVFSHVDAAGQPSLHTSSEKRILTGSLASPKGKDDVAPVTRGLWQVRERQGGAGEQQFSLPGLILQLRGEADAGGSWD